MLVISKVVSHTSYEHDKPPLTLQQQASAQRPALDHLLLTHCLAPPSLSLGNEVIPLLPCQRAKIVTS